MCPDRQLLSTFVDGEIPEPFSSRIASHIKDCQKCGKVVADYRGLSVNLRTAPSPDFAESQARVAQALTIQSGFARRQSVWSKSISMPLPIAAGVAVMFALLLALSIVSRPATGGGSFIATLQDPSQFQTVDFQTLKQTSGNSSEFVLQLPDGNFAISGSPVFLSAKGQQNSPELKGLILKTEEELASSTLEGK
jgi:hypothetical protein